MEIPIPVANGSNTAKNPSTIMTTAIPMDIPVASLIVPAMLCVLMFSPPSLMSREMEGAQALAFPRQLPDSSQSIRFVSPISRRGDPCLVLVRGHISCLCGPGLQRGGLGLENFNLGFCPLLRRLALFLGFLQPGLNFGVEPIDLFLELCFSVGAGLGMLRFQLREVRLHSGGIFVVNRVLYVRERSPEYSSAGRFHARVHRGRPVFLNLGNDCEPVWPQLFAHVVNEIATHPRIAQIHCAAGDQAQGCANSKTDGPAEKADETPERGSDEGSERPRIIALPHRYVAVCVLGDDCIGIDDDAALAVQLQKCLLPFVRFLFRVEDNYQHSVHGGFAPFDFVFWLSAEMRL